MVIFTHPTYTKDKVSYGGQSITAIVELEDNAYVMSLKGIWTILIAGGLKRIENRAYGIDKSLQRYLSAGYPIVLHCSETAYSLMQERALLSSPLILHALLYLRVITQEEFNANDYETTKQKCDACIAPYKGKIWAVATIGGEFCMKRHDEKAQALQTDSLFTSFPCYTNYAWCFNSVYRLKQYVSLSGFERVIRIPSKTKDAVKRKAQETAVASVKMQLFSKQYSEINMNDNQYNEYIEDATKCLTFMQWKANLVKCLENAQYHDIRIALQNMDKLKKELECIYCENEQNLRQVKCQDDVDDTNTRDSNIHMRSQSLMSMGSIEGNAGNESNTNKKEKSGYWDDDDDDDDSKHDDKVRGPVARDVGNPMHSHERDMSIDGINKLLSVFDKGTVEQTKQCMICDKMFEPIQGRDICEECFKIYN